MLLYKDGHERTQTDRDRRQHSLADERAHIEEEEIEKVVNDPQAELLVHRRGRPIEGRFLYRGSPRPGRMLEVECQLRADNGMYRVIKIREV